MKALLSTLSNREFHLIKTKMKLQFHVKRLGRNGSGEEGDYEEVNGSNGISTPISLDSEKHCNRVCVFGTCLEHLMQTTPCMTVPYIVSRLCKFIETYGLYQQCLFQEVEEKSVVDCLKVKFNESGDAPLESSSDVLAASVLLKLFFEELPEPLIPTSLQEDFFDYMKRCVVSSNDCGKYLHYLVDKLPCSVFCVLKYLSHFLLQIANHRDSNGLSCGNLGNIFGPIIFRPSKEDPFICIMIKSITYCFVADYYSIFEEQHEALFEKDGSKMFVLSSCRKNESSKQMSPLSSNLLWTTPVQPLRLVIPSIDMLTPKTDCLSSTCPRTPMLLIEKSGSIIPENILQNLPSFNEEILNTRMCPSTRKRKENIMTEKSLFHTCRGAKNWRLPLQVFEHLCEDGNKTFTVDKSSRSLCGTNELSAFSFDFQKDELIDNGPHPPNPKRRELDLKENLLFVPKYQGWHTHLSMRRTSKLPHDRKLYEDLTVIFNSHLENDQNEDPEENIEQNPDYSKNNSLSENVSIGNDNDISLHSCPSVSSFLIDDEHSYKSGSILQNRNPPSESDESPQSAHHLSWPMLRGNHEEEPISSSYQSPQTFSEAPLSPSAYRSYLCHRSSHLDPSIPPSPPFEQEHYEDRPAEDAASSNIKQLTKKIHALKKKIWRFEEKYESEHGYKPSHAEKTKFSEVKKLMNDLHKLRKSLKALKEDSHLTSENCITSGNRYRNSHDAHILEDTSNCLKDGRNSNTKEKLSVQTSFDETIKSLEHGRKLVGRPESFEVMTPDQVKDEKLAIQKVLLHFEKIHGRPSNQSDRNTVRPLYERYRNVKHLLSKSSSSIGISRSSSCNGLQPIMEHEAMDFSSLRASKLNDLYEDKLASWMANTIQRTDGSYSTSIDGSLLENKYNNSYLHELPLEELISQRQQTRIEKRRLHKILREFEAEFLRINGRKVQKEDKAPVETLYAEYKMIKARLRLLEALVSKHHKHIPV